jgi:hypothetical protein
MRPRLLLLLRLFLLLALVSEIFPEALLRRFGLTLYVALLALLAVISKIET